MLRVIELFAGIGSQTQALKNIGVEHEVICISDNDAPADKSNIQITTRRHPYFLLRITKVNQVLSKIVIVSILRIQVYIFSEFVKFPSF